MVKQFLKYLYVSVVMSTLLLNGSAENAYAATTVTYQKSAADGGNRTDGFTGWDKSDGRNYYFNLNWSTVDWSQFRGKHVKSAKLGFYRYSHSGIAFTNASISIYKGTYFDGPQLGSLIISSGNDQKWDEFEIKDLVQAWIDGTETNKSITIYPPKTEGNNASSTQVMPYYKEYSSNGVTQEFRLIVEFNYEPTLVLNTADNQVRSDKTGFNKLALSGTAKDMDAEDIVTVKYSIDGVPAHINKQVASMTATGSDQSFGPYEIPIDSSIPEGSHVLRVWSEDNQDGKSTVVTRNFAVDRTSPATPVLSESPQGNAASKTITITYTADTTTKEYKIDNGTWTPYTAPLTLTKNATVTARATDAVGNDSTQVLTVTSITPPAPIVETSEVSETSLIAKNTRTYSDPVEYQFAIFEKGNATAVLTSPWQDQGTFTFTSLLPNKKYQVKIDVRYK